MNAHKQILLNKRQQGVTLVELMVSMLVGVVLLSGVVAVYLGSKQSYGARGGMSALQENGRIAIKRLQKGVLGAGYPKNSGIEPIISRAKQVQESSNQVQESEIEVSADVSANDKNKFTKRKDASGKKVYKPNGDILTVSFMPFGTNTQDCLGQIGTVKGLIVNNYFVQNGQLMCRGSGNSVAQPIAEAVDNMQVLYGIDTDTDGFPNQYLKASDMSGNWLKVVSVQVALLINSIDNVKDVAPGVGNEDQFNLLGQNYVARNERLALRVFTTTIPLRNRMPLLQ
jgi:type IV pilus assembly protein PilW